jgi:hypothetical protein
MNITQHSEPTDPTSPSRPAAAHDQSHTPTRRLAATLATRHEREATPSVPLRTAGVGNGQWHRHLHAGVDSVGDLARDPLGHQKYPCGL